MLRRAPMKRTGFKRTGWPAPAMTQDECRPLFQWFAGKPDARLRVREAAQEIVRESTPLARAARTASYAGTTSGQPIDKERPMQHLGYMNLVRQMPCAHCGLPGPSQFCHSDEGKGTGIKSDCRLGWPGCPACHVKVGTDRIYPKLERRDLEAYMAAKTRAAILAAGTWPKNLPLWTES